MTERRAVAAIASAVALALTAVTVAAQPLTGSSPESDLVPRTGALTLGASVADPLAPSKPSLETLGQRLERSPVGLGVDVRPLRHKLGDNPAADRSAATQVSRLADTDLLRTMAVGLDLKLRWPSNTSHESSAIPLQPYLSFGPALLVARPDDSGWNNTRVLSRPTLALRSERSDTSMSLGIKGALGLTWQLTRDASLFGEYRLIQDRFGLPARGITDLGSADLLYGFSLRF